MGKLEIEGFVIDTTPKSITVSRDGLGEIEFSPGHASSLRSLIGLATRLEGSKAFPSPLRSTPFEVYFRNAKGKVEVEIKREEANHGICLSFEEFDNFIGVVDHAFNAFQNEVQLSGKKVRRTPHVLPVSRETFS